MAEPLREDLYGTSLPSNDAKIIRPLNAASFEFFPNSDKIKSVRYHEPESPEYEAIIRRLNLEKSD